MGANIFERLREERERLGKTQEELAAIAGVTRRPYMEWEKGTGPSPTAVQLAAIAAAGADVLYILTGQRSQGLPPKDTLPPDQQVLVSAYERCTAEGKHHLIQTAALLSAGMPVTPATSPKRGTNKTENKEPGSVQVGNMTNHATGGVQVGYAGGKVTSKVITKAKPKE